MASANAARVTGASSRWRAWALLAPAGLLYLCTFVVPLVVLIALSLASTKGGVVTSTLSVENYRRFFSDGISLSIFWGTVRLAALIAISCLVIGFPVALFMRRAGSRLRLVLMLIVVMPLLTSVIVRNVAWLLLLGRTGLVNSALTALGLADAPLPLIYNELGVVIGVTHVYLAFMILPILGSLLAIDRAAEESAASLGAGPLRVLRHITLPLAMPGIVAGVTLVFILSMGVYLTPIIMGGNFVTTLPMVITELVRNQYDWTTASAFAVILLAFVGAVLGASRWLAARWSWASQ